MQISHKVQVFFCDFADREGKSFEAPCTGGNLMSKTSGRMEERDPEGIKPAGRPYNVR